MVGKRGQGRTPFCNATGIVQRGGFRAGAERFGLSIVLSVNEKTLLKLYNKAV